MSVRYVVRHETRYRYEREVAHSHQLLHLTPRDGPRQRCLQHEIRIDPAPAVRSEFIDAFGNRVTRVELDRLHEHLQVIADLEVDVETAPEPPAAVEDWERVRAQLGYVAGARAPQWLEAARFRGESPFVRIKQLYADFAHDCLRPGASVLEVAAALTARIHAEFTYAPGETEVGTPLLEVFHKRRGVCQDYAHLMIACLRSAGLAARYVSGYLHTSGASASHAWVAVFAPPAGWVEYDPTNGVRVAREHVALAWGRDFGDVSPLRGVILGGGSRPLSVDVAVRMASA
ncbi:MAG TPA: transglutaminase family protein [Steroidobacteraceae bacterium]